MRSSPSVATSKLRKNSLPTGVAPLAHLAAVPLALEQQATQRVVFVVQRELAVARDVSVRCPSTSTGLNASTLPGLKGCV
jgi:hypothetical protein